MSLFFQLLPQVAEGTRHMPHLWDLCSNEIVVRSAKHVIKVTNNLSGTSCFVRWKTVLEKNFKSSLP